VQSVILTKVSDSSLLIVVTSSCFLKRIDMLKRKEAVSPDHHPTAQHICRQMYFDHIHGSACIQRFS